MRNKFSHRAAVSPDFQIFALDSKAPWLTGHLFLISFTFLKKEKKERREKNTPIKKLLGVSGEIVTFFMTPLLSSA